MRKPDRSILAAIVLAALAATSCSTTHGPRPSTPQMGIQTPSGWPDGWKTGFGRVTNLLSFVQLVPKGQDVDTWKETLLLMTIYGYAPARPTVDEWKGLVLQKDDSATFDESTTEEGSIVIECRSDKMDELSIRKVTKGPDGVYIVAYITRPGLYDEAVWNQWKTRIRDSTLVPSESANAQP